MIFELHLEPQEHGVVQVARLLGCCWSRIEWSRRRQLDGDVPKANVTIFEDECRIRFLTSCHILPFQHFRPLHHACGNIQPTVVCPDVRKSNRRLRINGRPEPGSRELRVRIQGEYPIDMLLFFSAFYTSTFLKILKGPDLTLPAHNRRSSPQEPIKTLSIRPHLVLSLSSSRCRHFL